MPTEEILAPPSWQEVETNEEFQKLSPEDKAITLGNWAKATRSYGDSVGAWQDAAIQDQFHTSTAAKLKEIQAASKLPETNFLENVANSLEDSIGNVFPAIARGATSEGVLMSSEGIYRGLGQEISEADPLARAKEKVAGFDQTITMIDDMVKEGRMSPQDAESQKAQVGLDKAAAEADLTRLTTPGSIENLAVTPEAQQARRDVGGFLETAANEASGMREGARQALPVSDEFQSTFLGQAAQGIGQLANIPAYAVPGLGPAMAIGQLYQEGYDDAIQSGATPEKAHAAAKEYVAVSGPLEVLADKLLVGKTLRAMEGKSTIRQALSEIAKQGAQEGGTEGTQQLWLNTVAKQLEKYDPERPLTKDVASSVLVGAAVGLGGTTVAQVAGAASAKETAIVQQAAVQAKNLEANDSPAAAEAVVEIAAAEVTDNRIESQRKSASVIDELLSTPAADLSKPSLEAHVQATEETQFAPTPAVTPAVETEAGTEQPLSEPVVVNETPVGDTQADLPVESEQQAARARVEEALAAGETPALADVALAQAQITTAQPEGEPNAIETVTQQEGLQVQPEDGIEGRETAQASISDSVLSEAQGQEVAVNENPPIQQDQPNVPEGVQQAPTASTGATEPAQQQPQRVQLRGNPQTFTITRALPQTEAERANDEHSFEVVNDRTGETQVIERNDIAHYVKPKSERVKKAIKKLPAKQQAKAEAATEISTEPDPYQGVPLTNAAPLPSVNIPLFNELSELGVFDEDATATKVLQKIADSKSTPDWAKTLSKRLLALGTAMDIQAVNRPDSSWSALYVGGETPATLINLARRNPGAALSILHEASHRVTLDQIRNPEKLTGEARKAYDELVAIHKEISAMPEFQGEYGISNVEEMVAEAFSNAGFRKKLDRVRPGQKQTLWQRFVNAIARLLFNKPAAQTSLLHSAVENAFTLAGAPIIESRGGSAPMRSGETLYHATRNSYDGIPKVPFYAASNPEYASNFGANPKEIRVFPKNTLDLTEVSADFDSGSQELKRLLESGGVNTTGIKFAKDEELAQSLANNLQELSARIANAGYDSVRLNEYFYGGGKDTTLLVVSESALDSGESAVAAMAESGSWSETITNPNASEAAEAKALVEATQELESDAGIDVTPLTPEQQQLLQETDTFKPLGLTALFARQFSNIPGTDFNDRQSEAVQGLVKAAKSYDAAKGVSFPQYAAGIIRNHMRDYAKSRKIRSKYVTPDRPVMEDDDVETIVSTAPFPQETTIAENDRKRMQGVAREALQAVMSQASERDRTILRGYASGQSLREIGAEVGLSQEGVKKTITRYRTNVEKALFLRGINDISEILAPVEEQTAAETTRQTTPEDEQAFQESTVGTLEAQDLEQGRPIYSDEGLVDEGVFAADSGEIEALAQNDAVSSMSKWISADNGRTAEAGRDADLEAFRSGASTRTLEPTDARAARRVLGNDVNFNAFAGELEKIFGKRIVFLTDLPSTAPSALFLKSNPDAIYINVNGNYPLMFLTGHEFGHSLKAKNKALYEDLQQFVLDNATDWTAYKNNLINNKGYSESQAADEFTEDFIGAHFNDGKFWRRLWQKDKPLFERLVDAAMDFLNALTGRASSMSRDVRPFFKNWEETRDKLVGIVEQAKNGNLDQDLVAPMAERPSQGAMQQIREVLNNFAREYIPPATKPGQTYEIDPTAQTVWSAILDKGQLPASLKEVYDRLSNRLNAIRGKVKVYTDDVKRAVESLHKDKDARNAEYGRIQKALTQEDGMTISELDPTLQPHVWKVRNMVDTLSQAAIDYGIVEGELADTFRNGIGSYLRRGYAVFDPESGWNYKYLQKKKPEVLENARAYLKQKNPEATSDQIETTIKELLDRDSAAGFILGGKKVLGKSVGSLMERKNIAAPIRELLGEIKDPLVNFIRSGDFLGQLIAREEMQQEFRNEVLRSGWASTQKTSAYHTPLVEDTAIQTQDNDGNPIVRVRSNRRYDVLRGLYTTPEFKNAFEMAEQTGMGGDAKRVSDFLVRGFLTASATAKTFATVLNPDSYAPNYIGAIMVEIANGRWKPETWRDAWNALRSGKNPDAVISAAKKAGIQDARHLYDELLRNGIFDQNVTFKDFEATLKNSFLKRSVGTKPMETLGKIYSAGDNLGKANAFVDEIGTLKKAYPDMPFRQLVEQAAEIVTNTTPTYSTVPKVFRDISQLGFGLQNFFNFVYSINRVAGYTAAQGYKEIRSGNPVLVTRGYRRLMGLIMVLSAASYWGAAMLSRMFEDLDDDKDQAFRRSFAAPWDRDANLLYTNIGDGKFTYSNTSYLNPFALVAETVTAVSQGKNPKDAAGGALRTVMGNFFSEGILFSAILDVLRNRQKGTTREVYNEELDLMAKGIQMGQYVFRKALTPKVLNKISRTYMGITGQQGDYGKVYSPYDEAVRLLGYRANTVDIEKQLPYRLYDLNNRFKNAERIFRSAENRKVPKEELEEARLQSEEAKRRVLAEYQQLYNDSLLLGIKKQQFRKAMVETDTQKEVRQQIR